MLGLAAQRARAPLSRTALEVSGRDRLPSNWRRSASCCPCARSTAASARPDAHVRSRNPHCSRLVGLGTRPLAVPVGAQSQDGAAHRAAALARAGRASSGRAHRAGSGRSTLPPVLVAHSLGVAAVVHAAAKLPHGLVAGALLVAPADVDNASGWPLTDGETLPAEETGFAPVAARPAAISVAGDRFVGRSLLHSDARGSHWRTHGAPTLSMPASIGHINTASGHGPWPDGLLRFGSFLRGLSLVTR